MPETRYQAYVFILQYCLFWLFVYKDFIIFMLHRVRFFIRSHYFCPLCFDTVERLGLRYCHIHLFRKITETNYRRSGRPCQRTAKGFGKCIVLRSVCWKWNQIPKLGCSELSSSVRGSHGFAGHKN